MTTHEPGEAYDGPAIVAGLTLEVRLRGRFEPVDGRFHWYGRVAASPALEEAQKSGDIVQIETPHGTAAGRLSDRDPYGRLRISGTGKPPF